MHVIHFFESYDTFDYIVAEFVSSRLSVRKSVCVALLRLHSCFKCYTVGVAINISCVVF